MLGRRLLQKTIATGPLAEPSRPKKLLAVRLATPIFPVQSLTLYPLLLESLEILVLSNRPLGQQLLHGARPRTAINRTNRVRLSPLSVLRIPRHEIVLSIQGEALRRLRRATLGPSLNAHRPSKLNPPQLSLCKHTRPQKGRNVIELPPLHMSP